MFPSSLFFLKFSKITVELQKYICSRRQRNRREHKRSIHFESFHGNRFGIPEKAESQEPLRATAAGNKNPRRWRSQRAPLRACSTRAKHRRPGFQSFCGPSCHLTFPCPVFRLRTPALWSCWLLRTCLFSRKQHQSRAEVPRWKQAVTESSAAELEASPPPTSVRRAKDSSLRKQASPRERLTDTRVRGCLDQMASLQLRTGKPAGDKPCTHGANQHQRASPEDANWHPEVSTCRRKVSNMKDRDWHKWKQGKSPGGKSDLTGCDRFDRKESWKKRYVTETTEKIGSPSWTWRPKENKTKQKTKEAVNPGKKQNVLQERKCRSRALGSPQYLPGCM